jgi:hypothetical protein
MFMLTWLLFNLCWDVLYGFSHHKIRVTTKCCSCSVYIKLHVTSKLLSHPYFDMAILIFVDLCVKRSYSFLNQPMRGIKKNGGTINTVTSGTQALKWSSWIIILNSLQEQVHHKKVMGGQHPTFILFPPQPISLYTIFFPCLPIRCNYPTFRRSPSLTFKREDPKAKEPWPMHPFNITHINSSHVESLLIFWNEYVLFNITNSMTLLRSITLLCGIDNIP